MDDNYVIVDSFETTAITTETDSVVTEVQSETLAFTSQADCYATAQLTPTITVVEDV